MKKRTIFAAALVVLTMGAQAQVIESYQVRDAVTLRGPIETDSINGEGRKYETKNLLSTAIGLNQDHYATQPMQADRDLTLPDGTKTVGDIMAARILTWGLPGIDPLANIATRTYAEPRASVHAGIGLTLRNGNVYTIEEDITEQIRKRPAGGVITIVIDADELPDNIVGEEPKPGGGFDASVDDWENEIEEEIII